MNYLLAKEKGPRFNIVATTFALIGLIEVEVMR